MATRVDRVVERGGYVKQSMWGAILTDRHFWLPVAVLAVGIALLAVMR